MDLCRAILHWEREQHQDALRNARSAARVFSELHATDKREARECEAIVLHSSGDIRAARDTYARLYELAETTNDPVMKARAATNLAIAYRDTGEWGSASMYYAIALQIYAGLGEAAMVAHVRWSLARLALRGGNATDAAARLPGIVDELLRFGMTNHAAHARLDLAEALLILGEYEEVESICSALIAFYANAEILTGALTAASYLKEATKNRSVTARHIEHIRKYLSALERAPDLVFVPPPDLA